MRLFLIFILFGIVISCQKEVKKYVLLSHTRLNDNSGIDSIVANADLSSYDVLMLGGDMANLSSADERTLIMLDTVFSIANKNTLWTLGNHDYSNVNLLKEYTKKETYYTFQKDNTTFIVLDTQKDSSQIIGDQLLFFSSVMDTVSTHNLIILSHKLIWMRDNNDLNGMINSISNGHFGDCSYCVQKNNFYQDIYPRLVTFSENKGEVYCLAGDIGFHAERFEYETSEGIVFLASGIRANTKANYFLLLKNDIINDKLSYSFEELENL